MGRRGGGSHSTFAAPPSGETVSSSSCYGRALWRDNSTVTQQVDVVTHRDMTEPRPCRKSHHLGFQSSCPPLLNSGSTKRANDIAIRNSILDRGLDRCSCNISGRHCKSSSPPRLRHDLCQSTCAAANSAAKSAFIPGDHRDSTGGVAIDRMLGR